MGTTKIISPPSLLTQNLKNDPTPLGTHPSIRTANPREVEFTIDTPPNRRSSKPPITFDALLAQAARHAPLPGHQPIYTCSVPPEATPPSLRRRTPPPDLHCTSQPIPIPGARPWWADVPMARAVSTGFDNGLRRKPSPLPRDFIHTPPRVHRSSDNVTMYYRTESRGWEPWDKMHQAAAEEQTGKILAGNPPWMWPRNKNGPVIRKDPAWVREENGSEQVTQASTKDGRGGCSAGDDERAQRSVAKTSVRGMVVLLRDKMSSKVSSKRVDSCGFVVDSSKAPFLTTPLAPCCSSQIGPSSCSLEAVAQTSAIAPSALEASQEASAACSRPKVSFSLPERPSRRTGMRAETRSCYRRSPSPSPDGRLYCDDSESETESESDSESETESESDSELSLGSL